MRLCDLLLQLFAHLPILLTVLVRHLIEFSLNLCGLGPELFDELELHYGLVAL